MPSRAACRKAAMTRSSSRCRVTAKSITLTRHSARSGASATKRSIAPTVSGSADWRSTVNSPWASLVRRSVISGGASCNDGMMRYTGCDRAPPYVGSVPDMFNPKNPKCPIPRSFRRGETVGAACGAGEQSALLVGRGAGDDALEGVPQRLVADRHLVDREVALEHAAPRPEQFDASLDIGPPQLGDRRG